MACAAWLAAAAPASAQTWLGGTSVTWTNGANWAGGVAPTATGTAVFGSSFGTFQPSLTSGTVLGLKFLKPDGGWTIGIGGSLRINSAGVDDSLNTSGTTTLNGNVVSGFDGQTWSVGQGGTIRVAGKIQLASTGHNLVVDGGVLAVDRLEGVGGSSQKSGSGTLLVSGSSITVSRFQINAGTVVMGDSYSLGSGNTIRALSGTLQATTDLTGANAIPKSLLVQNFTISGSQSIQITGSTHQQSSQGEGSFLTNNIVAGKTLTLGNVTGNNASNNLTMTFQGSGHTIVTGSMTNGIVSAFNYTKAGSGTLTLQGVGTYGGTMTVAEGTLKIENAAALGTSSRLIVSGGTLDLGGLAVTKSGVVRFTGGLVGSGTLANDTVAFDGQAGTVSATLAGSGGLTKSTTGLLVLSGSNTYTGTTTIAASGGRLHFAARNALYGGGTASWTAANVIVNTSGTLSLATGGADEFSEQDVATLLAGIGGTINNNGLRAGSRIGFDTTNAPGDFTIATNIADTVGTGSGAVGLVKLGSGTLVLTGSNSYTGPTNVNGGVLRLGAANALGTGTVSLDGGLLDMNGNNGSVAGLAFGGTTATGFTGGGTLTLGGTVTYTSNPAGAVIGTNLALSGTRTFNIGGSGVGADALTVSTVISSTGGLVKTGTGLLVLSGTASTYTGKTTIQSGIVEVSSLSGTNGVASSLGAPTTAANARIDLGTGTTLATLRYTGTGGHSTDRPIYLAGSAGGGGILDASGSGTVSFTGGVTGVAGTTLTLTGSSTGNNYITAITGSNVTKTGPGTWVFGTNSFTGQLTVEQGTIVAAINAPGGTGTSSALGKENGPIPVVGLANASGTAALLAANGVTIARVIEVAALGSGDQEVVLGGSGVGTATFDGGSAFRLGRGVTLAADPGGNVRFLTPTANWQQQDGSADPAVAVTIGTPTATGTVTLETTLPNSLTAVTVRQGTLRLGNGTTVGALGPTSVLTGSAGATLAFDRSDTISSGVHFASAIGGAMNVRQQGSGTVVLAGVNTYTGATDVIAGTLEVDGVLGNTAVTVAAGATLSGTGTIGGPTTILGTHAPGSSPGIETFTNGLTYGATSTLVWELIANTESPGSRGVLFDGVDLTGGALSIVNGATLSLVFDLPGSTVDWDNAFWGTNRAWTIIDVAGGSWNSSLFTLQVGVDSTSATLASKRPDSLFQIVDLGGDLVLEYVIVPEPGALALAGFGLAAAWGYHRRRRARTRVR
jgi:fibronectin-binding autotransporter adhesin